MTYVPLGAVTHATVHCTATPEGRDVKAAAISEWDIARFGQVSYHFVVERDGTIVNTLDVGTRGAHVGGHNSGNIGIAYVGGVCAAIRVPKDTRTAAQKQALRNLVARLRAQHPGLIVIGHRDWPGVAKACPSFDVRTEL